MFNEGFWWFLILRVNLKRPEFGKNIPGPNDYGSRQPPTFGAVARWVLSCCGLVLRVSDHIRCFPRGLLEFPQG